MEVETTMSGLSNSGSELIVPFSPELMQSLTVGHSSQIMFKADEKHSGNWLSGISVYDWKEMPPTCTHERTEIMYVISGKGNIILGDDILSVSSDMSVLIPPGTPHAISCHEDADFIKLFWVQI